MKLLTYEYEGLQYVGVLSDDGKSVRELEGIGDMTEILGLPLDKISLLRMSESISVDKIKILAPIPNPVRDIVCLGINYADHAEETAKFKATASSGPRAYPAYFGKRVNRATGDGDIIPWYGDIDDQLDYEVELAVIIGHDAKNVSKEEALDYVFGFTIMNDVTAREIQRRHLQWYMGKSLDGFCPMGPYIVTKDEVDHKNLSLKSFVNGELRQSSNTSQQIFDIAYVIEELSHMITLQKGTIIATGTPSGVGAGFTPPKTLKPGDEVVCEIEGIGRLTNIVGK